MARESGTHDDVVAVEAEALRRYGLRWAVLAAWHDALRIRRVALPAETNRLLERTRIELASGCFSVCEVGCGLGSIEGTLTSVDSSSEGGSTEYWIELLGQSMSGGLDTERVLRIPAVRTHFESSGIKGCHCPD